MKPHAILVAAFLIASPAMAQDVVSQQSLGTALAVDLAQDAVAACTADGYSVAAAVTDSSGLLLALIRADTAGAHTPDAATAKAYTSASTRFPTGAMRTAVQENAGAAGLVDIPGFLVLGGGVPVKVGDVTVGAIGVSGAPGGHLDEACINVALEKHAARLQ